MTYSIVFPTSQMQRHSELLSHKTDARELDSLSGHIPVQEMRFFFPKCSFQLNRS